MRTHLRFIAAAVAALAMGQASAQTYYGQSQPRYDSRDYGHARVVRCESRGSRTALCRADTRSTIRLSHRLSRSACIRGRSWGTTNNAIWVSHGCRAEFTIQSRRDGRRIGDNGYDGYRDDGYRPGYGDDDRYDDDGYDDDDYNDDRRY